MNVVELIGRLTKDPEIRRTDSALIAACSLAVDRRRKHGEEPKADFPRIVAFGKTAELVEKYLHKGSKIAIVGRIQTGSYQNKNGDTVYTTDVIADSIEFLDTKKTEHQDSFATLDDNAPF